MTTVLGIDQSFTSTGVVFLEENDIIMADRIRATKGTDRFDQAFEITYRIRELCLEYKPEEVGLEGLAFAKFGNVTRDLSGLQFVIVVYLRRILKMDLNIEIVPPTTLKKFATGRGNAKKEEMYACLPEEAKILFENHRYKKTTGLYDVTDAYFLAKYVYEKNARRRNADLYLQVHSLQDDGG
jgi:Holliday junction resolvasome RuvABC endonuclease subunit